MLSQARLAVSFITRHTDLLLIALVVSVLALMIVPLPTFLIDLLISANVAISFLILMMTMYVPSILSFSAFPSLLLFTTLFRLGLNIATTRLILLQADAGQIIYTFGEFAVGGNFIVGAVVFVIISVIQFMVIAKGAERVSEVGARFTLDAMPGKQMSIDADLRAGSISAEEAQTRRNLVTKESQMYGAMDGALKFVKGDAVAGLIVAAVNIVAGSIIGMSQNNLSAGEALSLYGILTIGDGLVSQIPSLLIAISAGILVTRSSDQNNLGELVGEQIFSQPKALLYAGCLVFVFALVPGFPKPQLFSLALFLILVGYILKGISTLKGEKDVTSSLMNTLKPAIKGESQSQRLKESTKGKGKKAASSIKNIAQKEANQEEFAPVVPLILDLSPTLFDKLDYDLLNQELAKLRNALFVELGVPFPGVNLRENANLNANEIVLNLNEIPVISLPLLDDCVYVQEESINLDILGISYQQSSPINNEEKQSLWVNIEDISQLNLANISYLHHEKVISYALSLVLVRHVGAFVGLQETKFLLDRMEKRAPDLVHEVSRLLPLQKIADLFNRLVQEQISIRDLRSILEAIVLWSPKEKDQIMLCEYIRSELKRQISFKFCGNNNILPAIIFDPQVEEMIRNSIRQTSTGSFLSLDPESSKQILNKIKDLIKNRSFKVVIIVSIDIRRYVRRLIEAELYQIPVLDYQELIPQISIQPAGCVRL